MRALVRARSTTRCGRVAVSQSPRESFHRGGKLADGGQGGTQSAYSGSEKFVQSLNGLLLP